MSIHVVVLGSVAVGSGSSFTKTCRTAVFQFDAIVFGANVATSTSRSIVLLT